MFKETIKNFLGKKSMNHFLYNKKAQLGIIEFKFAFLGLILGIILTLTVVYLANKGIFIPFKMSFVCPV